MHITGSGWDLQLIL